MKEAQENVAVFLRENTPRFFGVDFANISMADLVISGKANEALKEAEAAQQEGNYSKAIEWMSRCLYRLLIDYRQRCAFALHGSRALLYDKSGEFNGAFNSRFDDPFADVWQALDSRFAEIRERLELVELGIDHQRHARFQIIAPSICMNVMNEELVNPSRHIPSENDCHFCYEFVIETALRLQSADYGITREMLNQIHADPAKIHNILKENG